MDILLSSLAIAVVGLIMLIDMVTLDDVLVFVVLIVKSLYLTVEGIVKGLLPMGWLPRKDVKGELVLITGAGSGLGRLMAIEFAKLGSKLILWDINEAGNEETKKLAEANGAPEVTTHKINLADREEIRKTADLVKNEVGNPDILINNAGIVTGKKIFECPDELMEKTIAVNTSALLYITKAFVPSMLDRNHGHIVTIASMAGKTGVCGLVDYCASKHGAVGFHESLTSEIYALKKDGVKTTVICPFYINTGMFDGVETKSPFVLPILEPDYVVDSIMEAVLTNRVFLSLPRSTYVLTALMNIFPVSVCTIFGDYFGINDTMDHFKGRAAAARS